MPNQGVGFRVLGLGPEPKRLDLGLTGIRIHSKPKILETSTPAAKAGSSAWSYMVHVYTDLVLLRPVPA